MSKVRVETKAGECAVEDFIAAAPGPRRREEAVALDALHRKIAGCEPKMWG